MFKPIRSKDRFLIFGSPSIQQDEIDEVVSSMKSGWIGTGPKVSRFEQDFATYKEVEHVAAVNSCTAALHLSMLTAGLQPGDEVITTPLTFCATINAIIHAGAVPVLADVDPLTMNIDPGAVLKKIGAQTRAILPVHFAGRSCQMDALCQLVRQHDLKMIEDCAHAIETTYDGKPAGTFGDFGCFSFYVTKNIVTGEGGMVIAQDATDIARIKTFALHGMSTDAWKRYSDEDHKHYYVTEAGFKYNMMDIQAAIGIHQLKRIESGWQRRKQIWEAYNQAFADCPVICPAPVEPNTRHAFHLYTLLIGDDAPVTRDQFLKLMNQHNIGIGVHYLSIPEHPYYQERFGWQPEEYPHAMHIGRRTVSLPLSPAITDDDVQDIIAAVRQILTC